MVSYNSAAHLRECVAPLVVREDVEVVVVDNASSDGSAGMIRDLPLTLVEMAANRGFAVGCNAGWRASEAPIVLFLNPDATIDPASVARLAATAARPEVGAVAPKILESDGSIAPSLRCFPSAVTPFAQAAFLHRAFPGARWASELVPTSDPAYAAAAPAEWVSGACVMLRRDVLERLGGFDEGFFMYGEDKDLCLRVRRAGLEVRFEPDAVAVHHGGASAPRTALLPVLATSRVRYAGKHGGRARALLERIGVGLWALTHLVAARGRAAREGYARVLAVAAAPLRADGGRRFVPTRRQEPGA